MDHRVEAGLLRHDTRENGAEPLGIGFRIGFAVDFLSQAERLVFCSGFQNAGPGDVHLVERLNGSQTSGAALVDRAAIAWALGRFLVLISH